MKTEKQVQRRVPDATGNQDKQEAESLLQPRSPQHKDMRAKAVKLAEISPVATMPPASHIGPPIKAPRILPKPAAAKKTAIMVARISGTNSVQRATLEMIVNSKNKK